MTTQVQFRISGPIEDDLHVRAQTRAISPSLIVQQDWVELQQALRDHTPTFLPAEGVLLMDVLNSTYLDWGTAHLLWATVDDAREDDIAGRHPGVDVPALIARLRSLSPLAAIATVRAVGLAWDYTHGDDGLPAEKALQRAGLVR